MERNPNTDWFQKAGYGVFFHYLEKSQNTPEDPKGLAQGKQSDWEECVREFDVERFASDVNKTGAGYVMFSIMQLFKFMIAPNKTYDAYTGYKPGEACSTRDLIEDIYQALSRYNIPLILYFTGDGPSRDPQASKGLNTIEYGKDNEKISNEFLDKWLKVTQEYSLRYGEKIAGWWIDGAYDCIGYDERRLERFADVLRAGNPKSILAFNCGGATQPIHYYFAAEDYIAGERDYLGDQYPVERWIGGRQWHMQCSLGDRWGWPNVRYSSARLIHQIGTCMEKGGVITMDLAVYRDGSLSKEQVEVMEKVKNAVRK